MFKVLSRGTLLRELYLEYLHRRGETTGDADTLGGLLRAFGHGSSPSGSDDRGSWRLRRSARRFLRIHAGGEQPGQA